MTAGERSAATTGSPRRRSCYDPDREDVRKRVLTRTQIAANLDAALRTATRFFMGQADVQQAAQRIAAALADEGIPYAIAGGLAVAAHGHLRVTVDVDVLVTGDGLRAFKERWLGRGWVEKFAGSKGVRDAALDVKVDFLVTGDFPGDGKPKPVVFPHPQRAVIEVEGMAVVTLPVLVELKLASGMSAPDRLVDFADVIALIRANALGREFAAQINPWVREKYLELWALAQIARDEE